MRIKLIAGNALVLVRGYADGEQGPWRRDLDASRASIRLHENTNPNAASNEYALEFQSELAGVRIGLSTAGGATYGNEDLPNLRAAEVADILTALAGDCPSSTPSTSVGPIAVEILEGQVYPEHSEDDRRARVHLLAFLKAD